MTTKKTTKEQKRQLKLSYGRDFAATVDVNLTDETYTFLKKPAILHELPGRPGTIIEFIPSPLVCVLRLFAGYDNAEIIKRLSADDYLILRNMVPWQLPGNMFPRVRPDERDGRVLSIEVPWGPTLETRGISLEQLGFSQASKGKQIIVGSNFEGDTISFRLASHKKEGMVAHHILCASMTGYGKTNMERVLAYQMAHANLIEAKSRNYYTSEGIPSEVQVITGSDGISRRYYINERGQQVLHDPPRLTRFVLMDGKGVKDDGLMALDGLPGQIGPVASKLEEARKAIYWVYQEAQRRKEMTRADIEAAPRIVVMISEFHIFATDPFFAWALNWCSREVRVLGMHLIVDSQDIRAGAWGKGHSSTRGQFGTTIAFKVLTATANALVFPGRVKEIQCHKTLTAPGDAIFDMSGLTFRVYTPLVEDHEMDALIAEWTATPGASGMFETISAWPEFDELNIASYAASIGKTPDAPKVTLGAPKKKLDTQQMIVGLLARMKTLSRNGGNADDVTLNRRLTRDLLQQYTGKGMSSDRIDNDLAEISDDLLRALMDEIGGLISKK